METISLFIDNSPPPHCLVRETKWIRDERPVRQKDIGSRTAELSRREPRREDLASRERNAAPHPTHKPRPKAPLRHRRPHLHPEGPASFL